MLLVTGAGGQLGQELRLVLGNKAVYVGRQELDISDESSVKAFFAARDVELVINCAAYNAVDQAEDDAQAAERVNTLGPALLARYGRRVIHISTDYVFDGASARPWRESDEARPISVYGRTKLAGEKAVLEESETAVVIRTQWLYSRFGKNFVKTMRRLGAERGSIEVVYDQTGSPTAASDLAAALAGLVPLVTPGMKEVFHYSNEGTISWYDFACAVMRLSGYSCSVRPVESSCRPSRAARPAYSVLNKSKIKQRFGLSIPWWLDSLERCVGTLKEEEGRAGCGKGAPA